MNASSTATITAATLSDLTVTEGRRPRRGIVLVALALLVSLVAVFLNPGTANAAPARTTTEVSYAKSVARLLNAERAAHHLRPVHVRTQLIHSARNHNLAMSGANTMSHQVRGESALGSRVDHAGYKWTWVGENIGWNSDMSAKGVLLLEKAMYNEVAPNNGHRLNILNRHYRNVGVDVYLDHAHHKAWLTVDFGRL